MIEIPPMIKKQLGRKKKKRPYIATNKQTYKRRFYMFMSREKK